MKEMNRKEFVKTVSLRGAVSYAPANGLGATGLRERR